MQSDQLTMQPFEKKTITLQCLCDKKFNITEFILKKKKHVIMKLHGL